MPIYEYTCNNCKNEFEKIVRSTTKEIKCPKCESTDCKKKISAFSSDAKHSGGCSCSSCHGHNCSSCH